MITCGVCPGSKCISRVALGLPPLANSTDTTSSNTSSGSNGGLIGGIVGGLLGGGLLLCGLGYFIIRRRNKKNNLPLAFRSHKHLDRTVIPATIMSLTTDEEMQERAISGVIPVTFIPPSSNSSVVTRQSTLSAVQNKHDSFSTFADDDEDPFSDRPISNAHSIMTTTTNCNSRRGSMESQISHQQVATIVQRAATQITRAKPQIMRVNTVKQKDGSLARQGSIKTIQPAVTEEEENPFDDKNKAPLSAAPPTTSTGKVTDSVMSAPGDGEITIFWNGS
jgi:hypothetical protein